MVAAATAVVSGRAGAGRAPICTGASEPCRRGPVRCPHGGDLLNKKAKAARGPHQGRPRRRRAGGQGQVVEQFIQRVAHLIAGWGPGRPWPRGARRRTSLAHRRAGNRWRQAGRRAAAGAARQPAIPPARWSLVYRTGAARAPPRARRRSRPGDRRARRPFSSGVTVGYNFYFIIIFILGALFRSSKVPPAQERPGHARSAGAVAAMMAQPVVLLGLLGPRRRRGHGVEAQPERGPHAGAKVE